MRRAIFSFLREITIFFTLAILVSFVINEMRSSTPLDTRLPLTELSLEPVISLKKNGSDSSFYLDHKPKVTLVYLWGTWCSICSLVSPMISELATERKDLRIISIVVSSGSEERIQQYLSKESLKFSVINDLHNRWRSFFNTQVFPSIYLYHQEGELKGVETGYISKLGLMIRLWWVSNID